MRSSKLHTADIGRPLITIKEARKLLGSLADGLTNDEIFKLIDESEQMVRLILRQKIVPKST